MKHSETVRHKIEVARWKAVGVVGFSALALAGCGGGGESTPKETVTVTESAAPSAEPVLPSTTQGGPGSTASYQFNYRGGGSKIILVYPGTSTSAEDTKSNAQYYSGETYAIECQEQGRTVKTGPGEQPVESNVWYRLMVEPGDVQYASQTYGDITIPKDVTIPEC